jgi:hypothetical protein
MLSILISDAISFLSASLVLKGLPHFEISLITLLIQTALCITWTLSATVLWKKWVPAQKVAVLYSDEKAYESIGELHLDSDSFEVVKTVCIDGLEENGKAIADMVSGVSGVFLCGIPVAVGVAAYVVGVVLFKSIRREDCLLLPKGEKIARILKL